MSAAAKPLVAETPLVSRAGAWADYGLADSGGGLSPSAFGGQR
jgi:hypothetical protein